MLERLVDIAIHWKWAVSKTPLCTHARRAVWILMETFCLCQRLGRNIKYKFTLIFAWRLWPPDTPSTSAWRPPYLVFGKACQLNKTIQFVIWGIVFGFILHFISMDPGSSWIEFKLLQGHFIATLLGTIETKYSVILVLHQGTGAFVQNQDFSVFCQDGCW